MNIVFHEILENFIDDVETLSSKKKLNSQILSTIQDQNNQISDLKNNISNLQSSVSNLGDIINNVVIKFMDLKKEYIEDVKNIVSLNSNEKTEKLSSLIEKQNEVLIEKTSNIINDVVPKNQESYNKVLNDTLRTFQSNLTEDTKNLLNSNNNDGIKEFISNFDVKCSTLMQNVQSPIYNYISSSEERINSNIQSMKETTSSSKIKQETIMDELSDYLKKFRNSSFKGNMAESELENLLTKMYPSGEIINTSNL